MGKKRAESVVTKSRSYRIDVVATALSVLDLLGSSTERRPHTLSSLRTELGLDKSRVFRILETLRESGYVERDDTSKTYRLGPKILSLTIASMTVMDFARRATPRIRALSSSLQNSVSVGVLDGTYVRYVARAPFRRIITSNISVGTKLPAHATSMGKLLLSALPEATVRSLYPERKLYPMTRHTITDMDVFLKRLQEIRDRGYATADEELEPGLWGVAVALIDSGANLLAAISVSAPKAREPDLSWILPRLRNCATEIAGDLS